ncbi:MULTISPECIES: DUF6236 family protein [unclassified Streptomyces]|uniref:DUF6236 family protein n=1 Tax=unclassified Streptomyces TaxID=2593676 RepID=UPI002E80C4B6|nr:DUF6236 family protein [Streptomyces sp. NBC_00589]WTI33664.1 DUF6236 family protein [Streptomyces sp. NBC_00775]WUB32664.1 DUF6236 family protein [Streptomyces sp. NBC_00589]
MLQRIGLYYPYVNFRDEQWLKTAALYWPQLARIVPDRFPVTDSDTARALTAELDFVVPVEPSSSALGVSSVFLDVIAAHADDLRQRYGWAVAEPQPPGRAYLHWGEVAPDVREALFGTGLAVPSRGTRFSEPGVDDWVGMDPALVWVYKCALSEEVARRGDFVPTTDQAAAHAASHGWDAERVTDALLDRPSVLREPREAPSSDLTDAMGMLAVRIVVPEDLDAVPVGKIVELRRRHKDEFDTFNREVTAAAADLREHLADVTLPTSIDRYVSMEVGRRFERPLEELRRAMRGLGIDTAFSAANLKFAVPATLAGMAGGVYAGPLVSTATGVTFALAGLARTVTGERQALRASSPSAYLLSVEKGLETRSLVRRVCRRIPGAGGDIA